MTPFQTRTDIELCTSDDVIALRRLIDYAVEEAQRSGNALCAQILAAARASLEPGAGCSSARGQLIYERPLNELMS